MAASPLLAVMVKDTIVAESMEFSDDQMFDILLHTMQGAILGMTAYMQHSLGEGYSQLQIILSATRSFQKHVLAMDFNGHSRLWGPAFISENMVGEMVEGVLGSEDLLIINHPNSPATFVNELEFRSWIDVIAVSHPLMVKMDGWRVHVDLEIGSDHKLITFAIQAKLPKGIIANVQIGAR